jgi:hypothetical protein
MDKEQLRSNLRAKIQAKSIGRNNKKVREKIITDMQSKIKETYGENVDFEKILKDMNLNVPKNK